MSKVGIKREIDNTGRLCVPKEMRDLFNLQGEVELLVTEMGILIRKPEYVLVKIESKKIEGKRKN